MNIARIALTAATLTAFVGCADQPAKEDQLLEIGYDHLLRQQWAQAEADFQQVLQRDANNPYALLNLGVVYQQTEREDEARDMYQRAVESGTGAVAVESNVAGEQGRSVTQLAERNLSQL